jgi:hypothetical protein
MLQMSGRPAQNKGQMIHRRGGGAKGMQSGIFKIVQLG